MNEQLIRDLAERLGVATHELIAMFAKQWPAMLVPWVFFTMVAVACLVYIVRHYRQHAVIDGLAFGCLWVGGASAVMWVIVTHFLVQAYLSPEGYAVERIVRLLKQGIE